MKIAVLSYFSGKRNRGVETWAKNLKLHLSDFQIDIFSGPSSYNPFLWKSYDIIIPTNGRLQVLISRLVSWIARKPMIVFGHSGPGADDKWNLWCMPDVFVAFSSPQLLWVNKFKFPWTKIEKIPHAVDTTFFHPPKNKPLNPVVLCVAANEPSKRVNLVVAAVKLLPGVKLRIVGHGQKEEIEFSQLPQTYHQVNVFCFVPQSWEAFGLVFLEAMATNLPIVTTNDLIRKEIVANAGIFVNKPEDARELSQAIKNALSRNWQDVPLKQALKFSWRQTANLYVSLFKSLV